MLLLENESNLADLEQYFYSHFEYIRNLKSKLDAQLYMMLFESIKPEKFPPLTPIFEAGDIGRKMYLILEGSVAIYKPKNLDSKPYPGKYRTFQEITDRRYHDYQLVNILKTGSYFGEVALHQKGPRNASVCSITKVELAIITYDTYQKILALAGQQQNDYKFNFLKSISLFEGWRDSALLTMLMNCEEQYYPPFAKIFKFHQPVDFVYFIVSGEVLLKNYSQIQCEESPKKIKKIDGITNLTTGQYFGDAELYNDSDQSIRTSEAETKSSCKFLKICAHQFLESYRLFSTISKPRAISQRQLRHRSSMQEIRDKLVLQQQSQIQKIVPKIPISNSQEPIQPTMPQIPIRFLVKFGQIQSQDYLTYRSTTFMDKFKQKVKETDSTFINYVSKKKISQKSPLRRRTYSIK